MLGCLLLALPVSLKSFLKQLGTKFEFFNNVSPDKKS